MKSTDMSPKEIKIKLLKSEITQAELARRLSVSPSMIARVIDGNSVSDRVRRGIANAVGIDVARIWPSAYLYNKPRRPGRPNSIQQNAA